MFHDRYPSDTLCVWCMTDAPTEPECDESPTGQHITDDDYRAAANDRHYQAQKEG